jgi:hypothetical protein
LEKTPPVFDPRCTHESSYFATGSPSLQGAGGGVAASAAEYGTVKLGDNLMIAGLVFQVFTLILVGLLYTDFALKAVRHKSKMNPRYRGLRSSSLFRCFIAAAVIAFTAILAHCIYRVIKLAGGWGNSLMK